MSSLLPWVLLHAGHSGGISNHIIAYGIAGIGILLVAVGLYRLHTYDDSAQNFDEPEDESQV
jgi:hypothetical protein